MQNKISIIIPTLLRRDDILNACINVLLKDPAVDEIIIINNNPKKTFEYNNKIVKIFNQEENLYVNKSWNKGISLIKNEIFGLLNDDIVPCHNFCTQIIESGILDKPDTGLLGMNLSFMPDFGVDEDELENPEIPEFAKLEFKPLIDIDTLSDWGCAILGQKENYYNIPDSLKIVHGDNYLLYKNKSNNKQNYSICGLPVKHIHSLSVRSRGFEQILMQDLKNWMSILPDIS